LPFAKAEKSIESLQLNRSKKSVKNKTYTRWQDKQDRVGKIEGRVARMLATVAHVNSLMERINQWSLSVLGRLIDNCVIAGVCRDIDGCQ
jgi:hypothetical protein